jgi:acyl carrier protein
MPGNVLSATDLRNWLTDRVAHYVEREPQDIDPDTSLAAFGLDSVYTFALCGDIEDEFRLLVEPTLVWHVGTVNGLAEHLSRALSTALSTVLSTALEARAS